MSRSLQTSDRDFFALVSEAAFANPFGRERDELDRRIAGGDPQPEELLELLLTKLEARLAAINEEARLDIRDFTGDDRRLLEHAGWFHVFHRYAEAFDLHIEEQLQAGAEPRPLRFAESLEADLAVWGFSEDRRRRAIEVFFQMRRAFRFIGTALVGPSACMRELRESLWNNVFGHDLERYERLLWDRMEDFSTILLGETGTGKGAAASAIGRSGFIPFARKGAHFKESFVSSFVPLNLSEFPESLIESELFGHKKGAFTGATSHHDGALARVNSHGVVFLDEIGEVSIPVQVKLLRVLQDRAYTPVGSRETRRFEGRVVAATHRSLQTLREEGRLRHDFYYRLCSDVIHVPPLRTRLAQEPSELQALLRVIVPRLVGESSSELVLELQRAILEGVGPDYAWPGNVRELEQCVRRVLLTRRCGPDASTPASPSPASVWTALGAQEIDAKQLLANYCTQLYQRHGTYERVARITGLDRRTVKKHVQRAS
ncbi:MAG: sigma-54-dependent Fis family transcriptional regulator [Deltaproteobacteria bacterium]|nr:sigma-54-dependent Fis family transcriptional regulator [Deltaproteobacteria bacterium]